MHTLQSSLYASAVTVCLLSFLLTRTAPASRTPTYGYVMVYLLLETVGFVLEWLMVHPTAPGKSLWLGLLMGTSFLLAPCLWLLTREITEGVTPSPRSLPGSHRTVILIGAALTVPLIQLSHWGSDFPNPTGAPTPDQLLLVRTTMTASALLFLVQAPWYLHAVATRLTQTPGMSVTAVRALRLLMFVVGTNWFVGLLRVLHCMLIGVDTGFGVVFAAIEVIVTLGVVFALLRETASVSAEPGETTESGVTTPVTAPSPASDSKYARSALDQATRARIRRKLQHALERERVHLDSGMTLRMLCERLRENFHYVSQVINQDFAVSFYDLINKARIEEAKAALGSHPGKTVLQIAIECGFNSKSTFNTAFRQYTGSTPSEYRKTLAVMPSVTQPE